MTQPFEYHLPSRESGATRLLLLRHGEVHREDCQALYGQMDVRLSEWGEEQSRLAGLALKNIRIDAVYSSPLKRAALLGHEIARHHGLQPQIVDVLKERFFGTWQGMMWPAIEASWPEEFARYQQERFTMRAPGGAESFEDVHARVMPFINALLERHAGQTICITAHGGPLRIILADAMQMPLTSLFRFELDYCCLNVIDYGPKDERTRVKLMNATTHAIGSHAPTGSGG